MTPDEFRRHGRTLIDWIADYFENGDRFPVLAPVEPGQVRGALAAEPPEEPEAFEDAWADFLEHVLPGVTHWNQPGFHAYFANSASAPGVLGELVAAALNVNAMVWRSSPAATELEELSTDWLRQLLGLPDPFQGVINDTASSSTLYALTAARLHAFPESRVKGLASLPPGRVYVGETHSSVDKAVVTLGMGLEGIRRVETDERFGMRPDRLRAAIREDREAGRRPVAVVATIGTTSAVSVDPVAEVAEICDEEGLWLHVDAAYAGPAAACEEFRPHFRGWERSDSIVVNPHKWLFTPVDCSILFAREPERIRAAFSLTPEYLKTAERGRSTNLMDYGISLGRRFRALKLWFVLRYFGAEGIRARLREHVRLAHDFAGWVEETGGWETVGPTHFGTCVFRRAPEEMSDAEADALNMRILDRVNATGRAFTSHTVQGGRTWLRMSVGHIRTDEEKVTRMWELVRWAATAG